MLADIAIGSASSSPNGLTLFNGSVYFAANDAMHGTELWMTDGAVGGTRLLQDILPGASWSSPAKFTPFAAAALGPRLLFAADDGLDSIEPWITDGTSAGTTMLNNSN